MKRTRMLSMLMVLLLLLSGCGGSSETMAQDSAAVEAPEAAPEASEPEAYVSMTYSSGSSSDSSVYQRADAKLIRRCTVELQTTEFDGAVNALYELVEAQGGYFETSSVYGGGYYNANARRSGEYVVRVPAEKYAAFRSSVGDLGYVSYSSESTEDIGEQYYDTEARLKTLRTKQERLQMLLEKAENMEDIITLESALGDVEYEIERYSSTLNRYDGLVSFATFNITVSEVTRVEETKGEADSLGERMGAGFKKGLEDMKDGVEDLMVWASYHFVGIVVFAAVFGGLALVLRRKKPNLFRRKEKNDRGEMETDGR